MKILLPSTSEQILKVIPRSYPSAVDVVLTNEDTNVSMTFENITPTNNAGYLDMPSTWSSSTGGDFDPNSVYASDYIQLAINPAIDVTLTELKLNCESQAIESPRYLTIIYSLDDFITFDYIVQNEALSNIPTTYTYTFSIPVLSPETLKIRLIPYENVTSFRYFLITSNTFTMSDAGGVLINWPLVSDTDTFTLDPSISSVTYSIGSGGINLIGVSSSSGRWRGLSESIITPITLTPYLINNTFYSFKVLDHTTQDLIHRGKIFVTDQDINEFTINDGEYTERGKDNEYLTY